MKPLPKLYSDPNHGDRRKNCHCFYCQATFVYQSLLFYTCGEVQIPLLSEKEYVGDLESLMWFDLDF